MTTDDLVAQWLAVDPNAESRAEIELLRHDRNELARRMAPRIAFGTAGLRARMGAGFALINDVTVLQASQGLVAYLKGHSDEVSVVVGHDHRHNLQRFAEIVASAALVGGAKVYYLGGVADGAADSEAASLATSASGLVHTPMVPFSIDLFGASAGVMITSSHNPARDNGYKVYYGNGCQIIPPHDAAIAAAIAANLHPWPRVWHVRDNIAAATHRGQLVPVRSRAQTQYLQHLATLTRAPQLGFSFVYTPMHGVGLEIFGRALEAFDLGAHKMHVVARQAAPDPDFPTVAFPNPEEHGALDLAIQAAEEQRVDLVVANDPDADRFSVAVRTARDPGSWRQLTGNEIGFLFAMWVVEQLERDGAAPGGAGLCLISSTVSSQILAVMARQHRFRFEETLTGFKWIGNRAIDLEREGFRVPFAFEEAIGYMFDGVHDKDGVAAAVVWLQLYQRWHVEGGGILARLEQGYQRYGYFKECNGYYKLSQQSATTDDIFGAIRRAAGGAAHPLHVGQWAVEWWRDLTLGYELGTAGNVPRLPVDKHAQMISVVVRPPGGGDLRVRFTCRGSGTEPKLKVYVEAQSDSGERASALARQCWEMLRREWFRPQQHALEEVV